MSDSLMSFRDAEGNHLDDVWVCPTEVLACVPRIGLPSEFKFPKAASQR